MFDKTHKCDRCVYMPPMTSLKARMHARWHKRIANIPQWREDMHKASKEGMANY